MLSKSGSSKLHSFSELDLSLSGSGIKIDSKFVTLFFLFNFEYWKMNIKLIPHTSNYICFGTSCVFQLCLVKKL